jgi:flagellar L-ring protein precursor FlgH
MYANKFVLSLCALLMVTAPAPAKEKPQPPIAPAQMILTPQAPASPGSLYLPSAPLGDLARDLRASQAGDIVTIIVSDRASAVSKGTTKSGRKSSVQASISAAGGVTRATGPWANLAKTNSDYQLDGQGSTTRENTLYTTVSARVIGVTANGNLVLEGAKQVQVNSENQTVLVRGLVRPADISPVNSVSSDRVADLQITINGKGVVGDAVRRPWLLYRILLGLLPF